MTLTFSPVRSMPDRKQVLALYQGARDYFTITNQGSPTRAHVVEDLTAKPEALPKEAKHYGILLADDQPVGVLDYLEGYPDAGTIYIGLLLFPVVQRGKGYGHQVVTQLAAKYADHQRLRVAVVNDNAAAMGFWQSLGFTPLRAGQASAGNGHVLEVTVMDLVL